jgi:hypothetical protein
MGLKWAAFQRAAARGLWARTRRPIGALLAALVFVAVANPAPSAADPGLVGEWRFDEAGGQAALDSGPHGLDGQLGTSPGIDAADPERTPGLSGGALRFGGNSLVRLPDDASELKLKTFTIEAVVRAPSSPGNYRYLVSRGSYGCESGSYGLYTGAVGGIAIYVFDGSRYVVSAVARPSDVWDGGWHHVAGTFDGRALRIYVDGRPVGEALDAPLAIDYARTGTSAAFGRYVGTCNLPFEGDLDLVRLLSDTPPRVPQPPLPSAMPPQILPASASTGDGPPAAAPGAPPRACTVALSRRRIAAGRRSTVRARVTLRGQPARAVRVVAKRRGKPITAARTDARGHARLKLRVRRPGRVRISAAARLSCGFAYIRVARWGDARR